MDISIEKGSWKTLEHPVSAVRLMVFVAEQKVPKEEEIDALDPVSTHFVAREAHIDSYYYRRTLLNFSELMAGAAKLSVPLIADVGVGASWNDAH